MPPRREPPPTAKRAKILAQKKAKQQEDDDQSSMADAYLPEHILQQIFILMPTKPLVQLKCLSKQWNSQISDPKFMKLRSRRMIFFPSYPFHAIDNTVTGGNMYKLLSPEIDPEDWYKEITIVGSFNAEIDPEDWYKEITIVGSFNGILLLNLKYGKSMYMSLYHMILYNPFTGESKTVPHAGSYDSLRKYVYGFGYGTTAHDLKIVGLEDDSWGISKSFKVFSLETWSWSPPSELIGDYWIYNSNSATFANGCLYWNGVKKTNNLPFVLALDIKTMVFSEIEVPEGCKLKFLGTYNGRLCMICSKNNVEGYELRVMNGHGFGEPLCSIAPSFAIQNISHVFDFGRVCILDDGKLLISVSSRQLIIYDMFKDSYKSVNVSMSSGLVGKLQSVEYVESSISPSDICSVSI